MGGLGSGRRPSGRVRTVDHSFRLDLRQVIDATRHAGSAIAHLTWRTESASAEAVVVLQDDRIQVFTAHGTFQAHVVEHACRLGGRSRMLLCPGCAHERRTLYISDRLQCRECLGLRYQSQSLRAPERRHLRMVKTVMKMTPDGTFDIGQVRRPRYMRRIRFMQLLRGLSEMSETFRVLARNALGSSRGTTVA